MHVERCTTGYKKVQFAYMNVKRMQSDNTKISCYIADHFQTYCLDRSVLTYNYSHHIELALYIALKHCTICGYTPCAIDFS